MIQIPDSSPFEILHHDLERVCRDRYGVTNCLIFQLFLEELCTQDQFARLYKLPFDKFFGEGVLRLKCIIQNTLILPFSTVEGIL